MKILFENDFRELHLRFGGKKKLIVEVEKKLENLYEIVFHFSACYSFKKKSSPFLKQ